MREGTVVSDKMDKTAVVAVQRLVSHTAYGKIMKRTRKLMAHDPDNMCRAGDKVRIMETRPLSGRKRWRVVTVLERAE